MAALVLVVEAVRHHDPGELLMMVGAGRIADRQPIRENYVVATASPPMPL